MALTNLKEYLSLIPTVRHSPGSRLWFRYDEEGDVLYIHFREPHAATDS
jgi:hypothetical protein